MAHYRRRFHPNAYRFIGMKRLTNPRGAGNLRGIHRDRLRDRP